MTEAGRAESQQGPSSESQTYHSHLSTCEWEEAMLFSLTKVQFVVPV